MWDTSDIIEHSYACQALSFVFHIHSYIINLRVNFKQYYHHHLYVKH